MPSRVASLDADGLVLLSELETELKLASDYLEDEEEDESLFSFSKELSEGRPSAAAAAAGSFASSSSSPSASSAPPRLRGPPLTNRGDVAPRVERRLEAVREASEATALTAAKQQRRSLVSSQTRRRTRDHRNLGESIKSALIDSRVERFVATVPRLLPPPLGRVAVRDFRSPKKGRLLETLRGRGRDGPLEEGRTTRVLAWNVERGYRLAAIIGCLRRETPDVVLLSEVDVGCDRSQMLDVGAEIASALGLCLVFATEKIKVNDESFLAQVTKKVAFQRTPFSSREKSSSQPAVVARQRRRRQHQDDENPFADDHHHLDQHDDDAHDDDDAARDDDDDDAQDDDDDDDPARRESTLLDTLKSALTFENNTNTHTKRGVGGGGGRQQPSSLSAPQSSLAAPPFAPARRAASQPRQSLQQSPEPISFDDDADAFDGVEGVAILSRFDVEETEAIFLPDASRKNDPRKQRLALRVRCRVDADVSADFVAVHLDAFAGRSSRVEQFSPVLERWRTNAGTAFPTVVGGDLNTHNQGLALLHPGMTGDDYFLNRLWRGQKLESWSLAEAEWWQRNVFARTTLVDPFDKGSADKHNPNVKVGGLKLWSGKLDWLLYDETFFLCVDKHASKADVASDHPYLRVDLHLKEQDQQGKKQRDVELDRIHRVQMPYRHHRDEDRNKGQNHHHHQSEEEQEEQRTKPRVVEVQAVAAGDHPLASPPQAANANANATRRPSTAEELQPRRQRHADTASATSSSSSSSSFPLVQRNKDKATAYTTTRSASLPPPESPHRRQQPPRMHSSRSCATTPKSE